MFTQNKIYVATLCNECGSQIKQELSLFSLSGGKVNIKCPNCEKSSLGITRGSDGKIHFEIPCVFCPHPHPYTVSEETVFSKDLFTLKCTFTQYDICFTGKKENVEKALNDYSSDINRMMLENMNSSEKDTSDDDFEDTSKQLEVILSFINECANNGDILCRCANMKTAPGVEMQFLDEAIALVCRECGRRIEIPIFDSDIIDSLIDNGKIVLDDEK